MDKHVEADQQQSSFDGYRLYGDSRSGNCYKPALAMALLGRPMELIPVDVLSGVTGSPEFLTMNPNGKVPLLQLPDGRLLAESNAMLMFLASGSPLLPADTYQQAQVLQWLFFEQYSHEPYVAVARFLRHFDHGQPLDPARMTMLHERGCHAFDVMEGVLLKQDFFVGDQMSVADIALFAYTHVAADGGFDLAPWPGVQAWLERVREQPGHFDMADWEA